MAVSYRQGCEAAVAVGFIRWDGLATQTHTHWGNTQTFTDVTEAAFHNSRPIHPNLHLDIVSFSQAHMQTHLYTFRWNHTISDCAAFIDAMQQQHHYYL